MGYEIEISYNVKMPNHHLTNVITKTKEIADTTVVKIIFNLHSPRIRIRFRIRIVKTKYRRLFFVLKARDLQK